jgi:hypothetical protein
MTSGSTAWARNTTLHLPLTVTDQKPFISLERVQPISGQVEVSWIRSRLQHSHHVVKPLSHTASLRAGAIQQPFQPAMAEAADHSLS